MAILKAKIGGVWTDIGFGGGGGTDEVFVGPDAPTDANVELWFDTDAVSTSDPNTARWNSAWGIIAKAADMNNAYALTPSQQAVTPGLTFTALAGRRYRIAYKSRAQGGTNTSINVWFAAPATPATPIFGDDYFSSPVTWGNGYFEHIHNGDGVTYTLCCAAKSSGGTPTIYSSQFYVEDVGPVSFSGPPATDPIPSWITPTLLNGWTQTANYSPMGYRKIGDIVYLRGMCVNGTADVICTLPVGYRPPTGSHEFVIEYYNLTAGAWPAGRMFGMVYIAIDGTVAVEGGATAGRGNMSLNGIHFSVTP